MNISKKKVNQSINLWTNITKKYISGVVNVYSKHTEWINEQNEVYKGQLYIMHSLGLITKEEINVLENEMDIFAEEYLKREKAGE